MSRSGLDTAGVLTAVRPRLTFCRNQNWKMHPIRICPIESHQSDVILQLTSIPSVICSRFVSFSVIDNTAVDSNKVFQHQTTTSNQCSSNNDNNKVLHTSNNWRETARALPSSLLAHKALIPFDDILFLLLLQNPPIPSIPSFHSSSSSLVVVFIFHIFHQRK